MGREKHQSGQGEPSTKKRRSTNSEVQGFHLEYAKRSDADQKSSRSMSPTDTSQQQDEDCASQPSEELTINEAAQILVQLSVEDHQRTASAVQSVDVGGSEQRFLDNDGTVQTGTRASDRSVYDTQPVLVHPISHGQSEASTQPRSPRRDNVNTSIDGATTD
ncbi:hypothetical protein IAT40_004256 [Kwoniella sp. CBS 6097]